MAVTETTTESWTSRLGGAVKGVAVGLGLFYHLIFFLCYHYYNYHLLELL